MGGLNNTEADTVSTSCLLTAQGGGSNWSGKQGSTLQMIHKDKEERKKVALGATSVAGEKIKQSQEGPKDGKDIQSES